MSALPAEADVLEIRPEVGAIGFVHMRIVEFGIGDVPNFHHSGLDIDDTSVFAQHKSRMRFASSLRV
jgi:hypothetical protein